MFFRPRYLSILTTRRCTAACDHCCVGASPRATQAIPLERIRGLIDEASRVPSIELIGFTGGECFLLGAALDDLIARVSSKKLRSRVITNGYWAVSERAARLRLASLVDAGLGEMMLSTGTFHQRFVPVSRVIDAARAAAEAGVRTRISIEACDQSSFDESQVFDALRDQIEARTIIVGRDAWTTDAAGRGETPLTHERLLADEPDRAAGRCEQILNVISVTPAQELIACCGFPQESLPRMRLGSVANTPLYELLATAPPDLLKIWLHVEGPTAIARFVATRVPGYRVPRAASICEACVALQRDAVAMRTLAEHGAEMAPAVIARYLELQRPAQVVA